MNLFKIVVREAPANKVLQIHEVYRSGVGAKVQELINEYEDVEYISFTITRLR